MIRYNIFDEKKVFDFDIDSLIKDLLTIISKEEHVEDSHVISFILVNNDEIHKINKEYRNIDRPTDVISFAAIDSVPDRSLPFELGDIYISVDKVKEQAKEYGHSEKREFSFLVTHGMLHLLGYDHMKSEDEKIMFSHQDHILEIAKITRREK